MPDPYNIRLSESAAPHRATDFEHALDVSGARAITVLRALADAYTAYVRTHGRAPSIPFRLVSADEDNTLRETSPLYHAGKRKAETGRK